MSSPVALTRQIAVDYRFRVQLGLIGLAVVAVVAGIVRAPAFAASADPEASGQQIAVPAYINPGAEPEAWNRLIAADSSKVGIAVANVLNGPDYGKQDAWADVIHRAHASGKRVLGYVDTGYLGLTGLSTRLGSTQLADWIVQIDEDVSAWYAFYGTDMDGIFFDQGFNACGPDDEYAGWYSRINQYQKRHFAGMTVLNPGYAVPRCYENTADVLLICENDYDGYYGRSPSLNYAEPGWVPQDPRKFWHIIYNVRAEHLAEVIATSGERHAGYVYVTGDVMANPYDTIPDQSYWSIEQQHVGGGSVASRPAT